MKFVLALLAAALLAVAACNDPAANTAPAKPADKPADS